MITYRKKIIHGNEEVDFVQFNTRAEHLAYTYKCYFRGSLVEGSSFFNAYLFCVELNGFMFYGSAHYIKSKFVEKIGCNILNVEVLDEIIENTYELLKSRDKRNTFEEKIMKDYSLNDYLKDLKSNKPVSLIDAAPLKSSPGFR
jgi:hypothetical protein